MGLFLPSEEGPRHSARVAQGLHAAAGRLARLRESTRPPSAAVVGVLACWPQAQQHCWGRGVSRWACGTCAFLVCPQHRGHPYAPSTRSLQRYHHNSYSFQSALAKLRRIFYGAHMGRYMLFVWLCILLRLLRDRHDTESGCLLTLIYPTRSEPNGALS